jgi:hypothetical protein
MEKDPVLKNFSIYDIYRINIDLAHPLIFNFIHSTLMIDFAPMLYVSSNALLYMTANSLMDFEMILLLNRAMKLIV